MARLTQIERMERVVKILRSIQAHGDNSDDLDILLHKALDYKNDLIINEEMKGEKHVTDNSKYPDSPVCSGEDKEL